MKLTLDWQRITIGIEYAPEYWFVIHLGPLKIYWVFVYNQKEE